VRGATLQIFATCPVVNTFFMVGTPLLGMLSPLPGRRKRAPAGERYAARARPRGSVGGVRPCAGGFRRDGGGPTEGIANLCVAPSPCPPPLAEEGAVRSGITGLTSISASAKDRQAPLSSMRKRPQPREVLPVCPLAPVSPAARIAALRAEARPSVRGNAAVDYAYAPEDRGGADKDRRNEGAENGERRGGHPSVPLPF
jgi:hypothetical protein